MRRRELVLGFLSALLEAQMNKRYKGKGITKFTPSKTTPHE